MASLLQEQQQTPISKPPPYPSVQPTPTVTTPRSRRKAQTPRSSVKTESPAVGERSGIPSNSNVFHQNLFAQNRTSTETRVPIVGLTVPTTVGPSHQWGNKTTSTSHGATAHTLLRISEPLPLPSVGPGQYAISMPGSSQVVIESSPSQKQVRAGRTVAESPLPSMVFTASAVSKWLCIS